MRSDGRLSDEIRKLKITRNYILHPEGSVFIELGNTKVICTATIEESVPPFLKGSGQGWLSAEYSMLPRATTTRNTRDINKLKQNARSVEIQRLIGRSLRMAVDLDKIGERSILIDCDVLQADGGTRTAAINGGFIAMYDALIFMKKKNMIDSLPIKSYVAAISAGIIDGVPMLDLCYEEDSNAFVDMNIVMNAEKEFIEIQGTGEHSTFNSSQLTQILTLAEKGICGIIEYQRDILAY